MTLIKYLEGPTIVMFIGAIIIAIGSVWAAMRNSKTNELLKQRTEQLLVSETDARKKAEEIAQLNKYTLDVITGGDSFPYISKGFNLVSPNEMRLFLINKGKYPLYDVTITIMDVDKLKKSENKIKTTIMAGKSYDMQELTKKIVVGNMRPGELIPDFMIVTIPDIGEVNYLFTIVSRNSFVEETLHIRSTDKVKRETVSNEIKVNGKVIDANLL